MNISIIIPARGGSKRIQSKNMKVLDGLTLIQHAGHCAFRVEVEFEDERKTHGVSTYASTEDAAIYEHIRALVIAIPLLRPDDLAQDDTPTLAVIQHHLREMPEVDICVVLQPTNPFRKWESVVKAIETLIAAPPETDAVISVSSVRQHPKHMYNNGIPMRYIHHAAEKSIKYFNGAFVVGYCQKFLDMGCGWGDNVIPVEISQIEAIDIDDELDWMLAEKVAEGMNDE